MINKLIVFASFGNLNSPPKSGGQSSARRVAKGLRDAGFKVKTVSRHRGVLQGKIKHILETGLFVVIDASKTFLSLLFGSRKDAAFMLLTYSASLVPYELLLTSISKILGYKSILYLKGGKIENYLKNGSRFSHWMFYKNLSLQSCVFFEGQSDIDLLKDKTNVKMVYFPNYIFNKDLPKNLVDKPKDIIGLCYFGKIEPRKNVDLIIEIFNLLAKDYPKMRLTIVGGGFAGSNYPQMVDELITCSPFANRITRVGLSDFEYLKEMMGKNHIFLFPTASLCEGHSNSLNESMSQGLIPIVSNHHFNKSIVRDERFVVDGYNPEDYASKIRYIIDNCDMGQLSQQMMQLVKDNYVYENIIGRISREIRSV